MSFVRVEDLHSGHQYDVDESRIEYLTERGDVKVLGDPRWPDIDRPRPQLYRTDKAGQPARRGDRTSRSTSDTDTTAGA